jgi:hypothetical protein
VRFEGVVALVLQGHCIFDSHGGLASVVCSASR